MSAFGKHLNTANGFIKLKMYLEANEQLEQIDAEQRTCTEVLQRRLKIYEALGKIDLFNAIQAELERRILRTARQDVEAVSLAPDVFTDPPGRYQASKRQKP